MDRGCEMSSRTCGSVLIFCAALVFSCVTPGKAHNFSLDEYAGLITALKLRFHTECVGMFQNVDVNSLVEITKALSKRNVMVFNLRVEDLNRTVPLRCRRNRPLYVLLSGHQTRRHLRFLAKAPSSYPRWLLFLDAPHDLDAILQGVDVPLDCELFLAEPREGGVVYLTEAYRVTRGWPLIRQPYGTWSDSGGLAATREYLVRRRGDLGGLVLRVATHDNEPYVLLDEDSDNTLILSGFYVNIWRILERRLNFKSEIVITPDKVHGYQQPNGSWTGEVHLLETKQVDAALNEYTITKPRLDVIEFLYPTHKSRSHIYIRREDDFSFGSSALKTFSASTWFAVGACVALFSVMLVAIQRLDRLNTGLNDESAIWGLLHSFFSLFALFCQQGTDAAPATLSGRMVLLVAGLEALLIGTAYSGTMTSIITVHKSWQPFKTVQSFIDDGSYTLGTLSFGIDAHLDTSLTALSQEIYTRFIEPNLDDLPTSTGEGFERVCSEEKYAFVTTRSITENLTCTVVPIPDVVRNDFDSFAVQKNSPYRRHLTYNLNRLRSEGVLKYLVLEF